MQVKSLGLAAGTLIIGVVVGHWLWPVAGDGPAASEAPKEKVSKSVPDAGEAASLKALRARIRELERQLAERPAAAVAPTNRPPEMAGGPFGDGRRMSFRERMEELKKTDPARYANITNHMTQWRLRRSAQQRAKLDYLSSIDTSHMGSGAKKVHDELQDLIARREELEQRLHDDGISEDERHSVMEQLRSTHHQLRSLNEQERGNLITETAKVLGFEGEDAKEISATVKDIIEATDSGFGMPPPGGPRGGGPGGMPPPAR